MEQKEFLEIENTGGEMKKSIEGLKIKLREYLGNYRKREKEGKHKKKDKEMRGPVQEVQNPNDIFQKTEQRILRDIYHQGVPGWLSS